MSTTSRPALNPISLGEAKKIVTDSLVEVDTRSGEPVPDNSTSETPTASAAPTLSDAIASLPEMNEIRRQYGEAGVAEVVAAAHQQHISTEHQKLAVAIPGWSDPETRAQIVSEIRAHAIAEGFSEQEINAVTDARTVKIAFAAMQRDKLRAERRAADATQADGEAPAPRRAPRAQRKPELTAALERLQQTGRQRDAQRAIEALGLVD